MNGDVPISFQGRPCRSSERTAPIDAHAVAHDFAAVAVSPLVTGVLTRLGGRFDADVRVALQPTSARRQGHMDGRGSRERAALRDGSVLIDALGLEVRDMSGSLDATGSGTKTTLERA